MKLFETKGTKKRNFILQKRREKTIKNINEKVKNKNIKRNKVK